MALIKCKECNREVSSAAVACPGCGAKPKQPIGRLGVIGLLLFGALMYASVTTPDAPQLPAPSPEVNEFILAGKARSEARFQSAVKVLRSVKASMRDPESVRWQQVFTNDDGTVVCVIYRARNGFGGMNVEHATFASQLLRTSSAAWNKHCTKGHAEEFPAAMFASV